jgi:adenosine deaminase
MIAPMRVAEFIRALPKAELHLHFEGAVPWTMVRDHAGGALPERPAWWEDAFRFADFAGFREAAGTCCGCLTSAETYRGAAAAILTGLAAQNVRYAEISFDVVRLARGPVAAAELAGMLRIAAPPGLTVRVFGAFSYHKADRTPDALVEDTLGAAGLDGIDLHGDESRQTAPRFAEIFAEARRRGLATKAHAGELAGAASVRAALDLLGVRRVEHGVRAVEDDGLVDRLVAEGVTLDTAPWSNVRLGVVRDLAAHPLRRLHDRGVRITVSTDDPTVFGRSLSQELTVLVEHLGFALDDVARLQSNAFAVAALPVATRAALQREIEALRDGGTVLA